MKKALSIILALILCAALPVSIFAEDSGSFTMSGDGSWWVQKTFLELSGEFAVEEHETLTISSPDGGILLAGYNSISAGAWTNTEDGVSSFTLDLSDVSGDIHIILRNESGDYTIEWAYDLPPAEEEPAEPETTVDESEPAVEETDTSDEAESAPAEETAVPETGLSLAIVPAVIALSAVVISKRR